MIRIVARDGIPCAWLIETGPEDHWIELSPNGST